MDFKITIDQFDGPLDLMLHLIKEGDLDLFDLDIAELTEQYLAYIHSMQQLHLDIASEYMVELATLIEYKSKKLLPNDKTELDSEYEEDESELLVRRLIEYQKYKEITEQLEELYNERQLMLDKPASEISNEWIKVDDSLPESDAYQLVKAMQKCLKRQQLAQPYEVNITTKEISVDDRIEQLKTKIKQWKGTFTMSNTMEDCTSTYLVVVTFLSLLDMVNDGMLTFTVRNDEVYFAQGVNYG